MSTSTHLSVVPLPSLTEGAHTLVVIGRKERLLADDVRGYLPAGAADRWEAMVDSVKPGDAGGATGTWLPGDGIQKVVVGVLPEPCSRHNSPARPHSVTALTGKGIGTAAAAVLLALDHADHALAATAAVARALPMYSRKGNGDEERTVTVAHLPATGTVTGLDRLQRIAEGVRGAAGLVDMPTSELTTDAFVEMAKVVAEGASIEVIRGEELAERGYGGLWGVGKAATVPPSLVILSHTPEGATSTTAIVGKGIVYDTGGLSIKGSKNMPGMKSDMAAAAVVLHGFAAVAALGYEQNLHALLCLAENAVGPDSTRPDDILSMYSGKTVEVNNTDAEGRLVLADGVAHASKHLDPDVIIDMATLTGAQLMATGKRHAGIVSNDEELEDRCVKAGRASGDLVHPLPYVPEFYRKEFRSEVADMKNSVKDRMNAQTSCAAQFVGEHLGEFEGAWLHVDLAGPSVYDNGRGTGYGVALIAELLGA